MSRTVLALIALLAVTIGVRAEDYMGREEFLALAFPNGVPAQQTLWLDDAARERARTAIGLVPGSLRVRYWAEDTRSAWILEEIGKEQPITMGFVIAGGRIDELRVLAFRESRGGEIRHAFFTTQYHDVGLDGAGALDRHIDGITGATLSVRAVDRAARLALWLDREARARSGHAPG